MDSGVRVLLVGGTSNTGKSTIARAVGDRLGFEVLSTDSLARHPGRPWRTPDRAVPAHVADHYRTLTVDELMDSVLDHYQRLWPRIAAIVGSHAGVDDGPGLVLEGSALLPRNVASLRGPQVATVWLTVEERVLVGRIRSAGRYSDATEEERVLMDKFLARSLRFQDRMLADVAAYGVRVVDTGNGASIQEVVDTVLMAL